MTLVAVALGSVAGMTSCSTFMSRGPENAGGAIADPGPFVGSRFAYNSLYKRPSDDEPNLPQKIISPVILVADGGVSALVDVVMVPFDWNGSTVPPAKANRRETVAPTTEERARERMKTTKLPQ